MLLMIDNYDSFTFNLVQYFGELGEEVRVFRNDAITLGAGARGAAHLHAARGGKVGRAEAHPVHARRSPSDRLDIGDALREIEIEERSADELRHVRGLDAAGRPASVQVLPDVSPAANPGFDVTPARLVTGIITEKGIATPQELHRLLKT